MEINNLQSIAELDTFLNESIQTHRIGSFTQQTSWAPGTEVKVRLKRHDFDFSFCPNGHISVANELACGQSTESDLYWDYATRLFNAATLWWGWVVLEPQRGVKAFKQSAVGTARGCHRNPETNQLVPFSDERTFGPMEAMMERAEQAGLKLIGHALLYPRGDVSPEWLNNVSAEEAVQALEDHVRTTVRDYGDRVKVWHPVNENNPGLQKVGALEVDEGLVYKWVREESADAEMVNNCGYEIDPDCYAQSNASAEQHGAPVDTIGIRGYHELYYADDLDGFKRRWNHFNDLVTRYGKELRYTEIGANSEVANDGIHDPAVFVSGNAMNEGIVTVDLRDGKLPDLTEETQVEFLVRMYRMMYAHPQMKECSYWDIHDSYTWNYGNGGLLNADFTPKLAFEALRKLIHEDWSTETTLTVDSEGSIFWQGHYGEYEITAESTGESVGATFSKPTSKLAMQS